MFEPPMNANSYAGCLRNSDLVRGLINIYNILAELHQLELTFCQFSFFMALLKTGINSRFRNFYKPSRVSFVTSSEKLIHTVTQQSPESISINMKAAKQKSGATIATLLHTAIGIIASFVNFLLPPLDKGRVGVG
ncbi:hypothetical protein Q5691_17700 [Microcoleus sp. w1-18aA5]|uniref:hypothetical protein n=1 Tax=unclassified Microcoleus TaxID=2642155 RepID=UPI002FD61DBC